MIAYLDANIVIYFVEQNPTWVARVTARLAGLRSAAHDIAVSDVARLECLVGPFVSGDVTVLADYAAFFANPAIRVLALPGAVWERAARIRATHHFKPLDALHLATAVEHGCGLFLTNDVQLSRFPDITVEILM